MSRRVERWPALPLAEWEPTYATLHRWMQVVGKLRIAGCRPQNHWWHVAMQTTSRGFGGTPIRYGRGFFDAEFDFLAHQLVIATCRGEVARLPLRPQPVAEFYGELMDTLAAFDIDLPIWKMPVEIQNPVPFDEDFEHASYDPDAARRFWRICLEVDDVFREFRSRFVGKASPVHFMWGSFDLCVTFFSGRRAPPRPGDAVVREAYSHECFSVGFWPGGAGMPDAAFYAYMWPIAPGFAEADVGPTDARWSQELGEFVLPYESVRTASEPRRELLRFLEDAYDAAMATAGWDRANLEREPSHPTPRTTAERIAPEQPTL